MYGRYVSTDREVFVLDLLRLLLQQQGRPRILRDEAGNRVSVDGHVPGHESKRVTQMTHAAKKGHDEGFTNLIEWIICIYTQSGLRQGGLTLALAPRMPVITEDVS